MIVRLTATLMLAWLFISMDSLGQCSYRVKNLDSVAYIVPPRAALKFTRSLSLARRSNIQQIVISNLSSDYHESVAGIRNATYRHSATAIKSAEVISATNVKLENDYGEIFYNNKKVWIYIDFRVIFSQAEPHDNRTIVTRFNRLAINLLRVIQSVETKYWNTGLSQSIVEKVFELIPSPVNCTNTRFGIIQTSEYSLLPLSPKIHLRIDHNSIVDARKALDVTDVQAYLDKLKRAIDLVDPDQDMNEVAIKVSRPQLTDVLLKNKYRYEWAGQSIISLPKSPSDNREVFFKLNPFISSLVPRDGTVSHSNSYPNAQRRLLSSSIDLEVTSDISNSHYLFLFQKYQRENNSHSVSGEGMTDCCLTDRLRCNSLIFFRNDLQLLSDDFRDCDQITGYGIFGERSPIVPVIAVYVENDMQFLPLGSTISDLVTEGYLAGNFKLLRQYKDRIRKVSSKRTDLVLLPGDRLYSR